MYLDELKMNVKVKKMIKKYTSGKEKHSGKQLKSRIKSLDFES